MDFPGARAHEHLANLAVARVLAVAALIGMTLAVAGVIIVSIGGSDGDSGDVNQTGSGATRAAAECTPGAAKAVEAGYYVLKEGEGFSDVAEKTCLDVDRIERLNPNLDPIALPARGCVDLVERGCKALATEG